MLTATVISVGPVVRSEESQCSRVVMGLRPNYQCNVGLVPVQRELTMVMFFGKHDVDFQSSGSPAQ